LDRDDTVLRILKRILLIGWALLLFLGFLIVEFPNAAWNHAASWIVWVLSIGLVFSTIGFCLLVAIRLISRLTKPRGPLPIAVPQPANWSRLLLLGFMVVVALSVFLAFLLVSIEHEFKATLYETSVATARASPELLGMLGTPINVSWFVSGQISQSTNGGGKATLTIPLRGPRGLGRLWVQAQRQAGAWRFSTLQFLPDGQNRQSTCSPISPSRQPTLLPTPPLLS
jgi:hypothetical protein